MAGVVISAFALVFGFAFVWHIWWLVIASSVGMVGSWIAYSFQRSKDYFVEVSEVNAIEGEHLAAVERAKKNTQAPQQDDDVSPDDDLKPADATA